MIKKLLIVFLLFGPAFVFAQSEAIIKFKQRLVTSKSDDKVPDAGDSTRRLHLMIAGNLYQTEKHASYCFDEGTGKYNFRDELKYIQPILSLGDITLTNLKTSFGGDIKNMFSSPDEFALAMKYSGINGVMHANLHTAHVDRAAFNRTRDLMNDFGLFYTGAFADPLQRTGNFPLIINKKGFRLAILNYGTLTSRPAISRNFYINEIDKNQIERDMRMAKVYKPDFIIVYLDWGAIPQSTPSFSQMDIARFCFEQGANLVAGAHANTPMQIDFMSYQSNGVSKEGIVAYSLGNLIASNDDIQNRNGYLLDMELTKNNYTGDVNVADWGVIPVYTYYDTSSVKGAMKVYTVPCAGVESGDILPNIPYIEKRRVVNGSYEIRKLLGGTADEIQYNVNELVANNVMETIDLTNAAWNNKYSQKRKEDVPESEAPVLPTATIGTNNPPSLTTIYEDPIKKMTAPSNTTPVAKKEDVKDKNDGGYTKEKTKAEEIFAGTASPSSTSSDNPVSAVSPVNFNTGATEKATNKEKEITPATGSNTGIGTTNTSTPTPVNDVKNAPVATNNTSSNNTTGNAETKEKATNPVVASNDAGTKKKTQAEIDEEENKKKNATPTTGGTAKTTTPANTTYRTEGNKYEVDNPEYSSGNKKPAPDVKEQRPDESTFDGGTKNVSGITSGTKSEIKSDITPVKEKNLRAVVDTFYRIQFYALKKYLPLDTNYYTHLKGYEVLEENGYFKYLLGKYPSYQECLRYWKSQIQPRYKESFIVKYINGRRVLD